MNALALPLYQSMLALIAAIGIVAALYWLKPPPRRVVVPSSLVWDRVLRESHPGSDRLRWWLSLLLAALIAAVVVSAIVPLSPAGASGAATKLILVLDDSPTMATRTTDGTTRWDHALAKARALMEARAAGTQIWLADTMRRVATPAFENRDDALAQLARLRVSYGPVPTVPLPELPAGIETVVITDGVSIGAAPAQARLESVFESVENAGITAFEVRALPADPRRYLAYVELVNASGVEKRIELAIVGVGDKRISRVVQVASGSARNEMIDISDFDSGPVRASIVMPGDGLAIDDVAYSILPVRRVVRVALVTSGNPYLEKSLQAQPRVDLTVVTPGRYVDDRGFDAVVFDRHAPKVRPHVPALLFRPSRADWLPSPQKEIANVSATAWNAAHPLLENISLLDLNVDRATVVGLKGPPQESASVLASAPGNVPLIIAHEDGVRWTLFSFALEESNFALHAGFPIFLNNALDWMLGERAVIARGLGSIEVPVSGARALAADGKELPMQPIPGGSLFEVDTPGLFTVVSAHQRLRVAANLFDRRITDVNKSRLAQIKPDADTPIRTNPSFAFDSWFALLLIAALLLMFEWWSWNRRMTV
ncbi:MAG: BatA domain-containing protein [Betaproteobacteria bacterium]|nr:BatA domain-containing protein [Betaproteobacteria bacterium]